LLLVPVPSAPRAVAARGHDPVRRVALAAAGVLRREGVPACVVAALRQRRTVRDQSGLGARQRRDNLAGALEPVRGAGRLLATGRVVLVDDLMTTGASLAEAARAVAAVSGPVVGAAVISAPRESFVEEPREAGEPGEPGVPVGDAPGRPAARPGSAGAGRRAGGSRERR
ncbi:phosphoribosyltransferase family protein, partial [Streptomyces sp. B1866]|uniref:ComF family protein n=1 Tax=Streptomyces sp. B1866 TaxID=3075431 RepID=UPI002890939C